MKSWDLANINPKAKHVKQFRGHQDPIRRLRFVDDKLYSGSEDATVRTKVDAEDTWGKKKKKHNHRNN